MLNLTSLRFILCIFAVSKKNQPQSAFYDFDKKQVTKHFPLFSIDATDQQLTKLQSLQAFFTPYGIHEFFKGGSGVDIAPLKNYYQMAQAGLVTDSQRYFDLHHSANDTFDQINRREMNLGTAAMAALIFLIDELNLLED